MRFVFLAVSAAVAALPLNVAVATPDDAGSTAASSPLETVTVTANRYAAETATSGTKTNVPLIETPMSIQVVSRDALDDLQVIGLKDGIRNVSGVTSADYSFYDFVQIRGFTNGYAANYHDGLQLQAITGLEMALVERIEIVKGPASMLYGRIEPGGLVNLVTKQPQEATAISIQQQVGNFGLKRTSADFTGSLSGDDQLLYRVIGAYSESDSHLDFVHKDNLVGAAHLAWRPSERFALRLNVEKQDHRFMDTEDQGIPIIGNRIAPVPRSRYYGDPVNRELPNEQDRTLVAADWTWKVSDRWTLTQRMHWDDRDEQQLTLWFGGFDGVDTIDRGVWFVQPKRETLATNLDLTGDVELGGMRHRILVGADWFKFTSTWHGFSDFAPGVVDPISLSAPAYGISAAALRALPENFFYADADKWKGLYVQDQVSLTERLDLLVGGRYDWAETGNGFSGTSLPEADAALELQKDEAFSPRAGLLYQLTPQRSIYASYTSSFGSNNGRTASGARIDPQEGEQFELGFKANYFEDRLALTSSIFELTKSNVLTADLSTPDPDDNVAIGEVRNRGLEVDLTGQLTRNVSVLASYAFSDAVITRDNSGNQGHRMRNVPRHAASVWAKFDAAPSAATGLEFGAGVYVSGERQGDDANSWQLPGYARLDAMVGFRLRVGETPVKLQLNVQNLLDETYVDRGNSNAKYGAPRTVIGSVRVDF